MKKKLTFLLIFVLCSATLFSLFGCNKKYEPMDNPIDAPDLLDNAKIIESTGNSPEKLKDSKTAGWTAKLDQKTDCMEFVVFDFGQEVTFNTAIIEEKGSNVRFFRLQKSVVNDAGGEVWEDFYRSDKIEDYRMCAFTNVATKKLKFIIDDSEGKFTIKELSIYYIPKKELEKPFRVSAYVRFDGDNPQEVLKKGKEYTKIYAQYYEVITDVIIFGPLGWDNEGNIVFFGDSKAEDPVIANKLNKIEFEEDLIAFRKILNAREKKTPVKITATFFNPANTADSLTNHMDKIVDNIYKTVIDFKLDGIDIDWEYPNNKKEWDLYDQLINKINDKFDTYKEKDLTYSSALSSWGVKLKKETINRIDQLNYMGYDAFDKDGWHSTFKVTAVDAMAYYQSLGFDAHQINLGIPYYARPVAALSYWPIWRNYDFGEEGYWKNYYHNLSYSGKVGSCYFNSPGMVADKTAYSINVGLGGVMVFRLACDKLMDDPNSLTLAIGKTISERIA